MTTLSESKISLPADINEVKEFGAFRSNISKMLDSSFGFTTEILSHSYFSKDI